MPQNPTLTRLVVVLRSPNQSSIENLICYSESTTQETSISIVYLIFFSFELDGTPLFLSWDDEVTKREVVCGGKETRSCQLTREDPRPSGISNFKLKSKIGMSVYILAASVCSFITHVYLLISNSKFGWMF